MWMKSLSVTIQMKATEQSFPVVLFIMLNKVVLTFESVDEILKCDQAPQKTYFYINKTLKIMDKLVLLIITLITSALKL